MKTWRPNQSGTFSNRTAVHDKDDRKLFVVEFTEHPDMIQRADIITKITTANEVLEALTELYNAIDSCVEITPDVMQKAGWALKMANNN